MERSIENPNEIMECIANVERREKEGSREVEGKERRGWEGENQKGSLEEEGKEIWEELEGKRQKGYFCFSFLPKLLEIYEKTFLLLHSWISSSK